MRSTASRPNEVDMTAEPRADSPESGVAEPGVAEPGGRSIRLAVINASGLHARPAALFVRTASQFRSAVQVRNVSRSGAAVDAKSILGVLTLGVARGHEIEVSADGDDADEALGAIAELVRSGIGEGVDA
jgi:phosphotransferase system HPr (HPr) family protein